MDKSTEDMDTASNKMDKGTEDMDTASNKMDKSTEDMDIIEAFESISSHDTCKIIPKNITRIKFPDWTYILHKNKKSKDDDIIIYKTTKDGKSISKCISNKKLINYGNTPKKKWYSFLKKFSNEK